MSVVLSMQDVGPWRKQLTVEVPAPAVEAETQRVVREFGQRVRIPGFRRGKVPSELVRRRFAKDIEREVIDRLLPRYWRQAQAESEIEPLLPPEVDEVRELEPGQPLTFVATVETRPRVELRNVTDFELPDPEVEPGELDVDKALEDLRVRFGVWVPVERPAARGDLVAGRLVDITDAPAAAAPAAPGGPGGFAAPGEPAAAGSSAAAPDAAAPGAGAAGPAPPPSEPMPAGPAPAADPAAGPLPAAAAAAPVEAASEKALETSSEKEDTVEFEVGDERVWEELSLAVSGLAEGQETTFRREAGPAAGPAPSADAAAATGSRLRRFRIRVSAVKERELPALDDELAARVNPELGGLSELRQAVARRLREARIEQRDDQRQRALFDQLRERHPMELPQGVVQREVEHLAADYAENLNRRGLRPEQLGLDWQRVREEVRPVAERRVHVRLLLDAIADATPVVVTDEELERALATLARAQKTTTPALRKALDENGRLATLRDQMRRDKTMRHLLGEIPTAADVPPLDAAAGDTPAGHPGPPASAAAATASAAASGPGAPGEGGAPAAGAGGPSPDSEARR